MALIKCKECGKEISSTATTCPNCGKQLTTPATKFVLGLAVILGVTMLGTCVGLFRSSAPTTSGATNRVDCLDTATAKPALDSAAARIDAGVRAAKRGDIATAASQIRSAATSLRTAANAESADQAISQPLIRAGEAYDKAADAYASGDETLATLYATAAVASVEASGTALRQSGVPRCR